MLVTINGWPITAAFGSIDPAHPLPHKGVDFGVPLGTPIPSIGDGTITAITNEGNKSFGLAIHERLSDGTDVIYGHLSKVKVQVGQHVKIGDLIASSGSTGDSTGPHLHLQTMVHNQPVDPTAYLMLLQWKIEMMHHIQRLLHIVQGYVN